MAQPFFAVRVVIEHTDGSSTQRDYVRGAQHLGKDRFASFALGDMLHLVTRPKDGIVSWKVEEVDFETVRQNRIHDNSWPTEYHG